MGNWRQTVDSLQVAAESAPLESLPDLLAELERAKATAYARLLRAQSCQKPQNQQPADAKNDRLLRADEAAQRLGVEKRWIYRHANSLPFTRRLSGKCLRFSERGLERYLATRW